MNDRKPWRYLPCYLLPLVPAIGLFGLCLHVMLSRLFYPYALEWIEGGMLQPVVRILQGLPLYTAPDMEYVPPLYAPLYFYLAAWSAYLTDAGLPALRLVSLLAASLTASLVALSVWRLSRSIPAALLALFCWGAVYRFSGYWYDVGRVDSLWALWLLAAVASLVYFRQVGRPLFLWMALPALVLAVLTKQTSLMLLPFFLLALWCWAGFFRAVLFGMGLLLALLLVVGLLQWQSDGQFYFYTMQMADAHHFNHGIPLNFLEGDLLFGVPVYLALSCFFALSGAQGRSDRIAWSCLLSGFLVMSLLSRWYSGGYFNVLIPLHQLLLLMGCSGLAGWLDRAGQHAGWRRWVRVVPVILFLSLNIAFGWFKPATQIPTQADRDCGDKLVAGMAGTPGNVCVFKHNYLSWLAHKPFCAHEAFAVDAFNGSDRLLAEKLAADFRHKLYAGDYRLLLMDSQVQFAVFGVDFRQLPYTMKLVDCPRDVFYPRVQGQRPVLWMEFNGQSFRDARELTGP